MQLFVRYSRPDNWVDAVAGPAGGGKRFEITNYGSKAAGFRAASSHHDQLNRDEVRPHPDMSKAADDHEENGS
jgi:hypothetical protein